ncbi:MAG: glutamine--fructose-6-phosphate transaminase (isomerizing) [Ruminococcaceae bacterium]|nr:glutamine--fructose-6-phosphate transaminase (isomerizing) [Oscillospiraceae bacterium]
MCGIIGFTGKSPAVPKLLEGLAALEYRGYDSAGAAYFTPDGLRTEKVGGRLSVLASRLSGTTDADITCGIGHTRWATHGTVSDANAHPHGNGRVYGVHNGIIENYRELTLWLAERGYTFTSDTDTERAVLLIDCLYRETGDPVKAMGEAAQRMTGSFAFALLFADRPGKIYAMRRGSPLFAAVSPEGTFAVSDIAAVLRYTRHFTRIGEGETAVLTAEGITFIAEDGSTVEKEYEWAEWDRTAAEKGGFPHFMLKEIWEEPTAVSATLAPLLSDSSFGLTETQIQNIRQIHIAACGTAMHAGLMGKYFMEKLARIPVNVEISSEFRYRDPILHPEDPVILISQSGETADTLAALRLAKERGNFTLAVVNVPGSAIAGEADAVLYTAAGPEIAVASTKAYTVQLAVLIYLAIRFGRIRGTLTQTEADGLLAQLADAHLYIEKALALSEACRHMAEKYRDHKNIFFIGRGRDYALSLEAALKMKEITYIHCEAYAAGEMKHGTISLIEKGTPVFAFATESAVWDKLLSNIQEVRSRGAQVLLFAPASLPVPEDAACDIIRLPDAPEICLPLCAAVPAQLMAYHTAVLLGRDVDKPRNLAKSVTVE